MNNIIIQDIKFNLDRLHESIVSTQHSRIELMHDARIQLRDLSVEYPSEFSEGTRTWFLESILVKRPHLAIAARILRYYTSLDDTQDLLLYSFLEELINKFEIIEDDK